MHPLTAVARSYIFKFKLYPFISPINTQVRWHRWKKIPTRKPRCLPMTPHKIFRIPKHPEVPKEEIDLNDELVEEYYTKIGSLKKLFQEELKQKTDEEDDILIVKQREEENFKLLLEENRKENERIRIIREETIEQEFQEQQLEFLQKAEEKQKELYETKLLVEEIVRAEKEKVKSYITLENIDQAIEKAMDNPVNFNFSLTKDGTVNWEGKPTLEYEEEINRRLQKGKKSMYS